MTIEITYPVGFNKIDLKKYNLSKDLTQNGLKWRNKVHISDIKALTTTAIL